MIHEDLHVSSQEWSTVATERCNGNHYQSSQMEDRRTKELFLVFLALWKKKKEEYLNLNSGQKLSLAPSLQGLSKPAENVQLLNWQQMQNAETTTYLLCCSRESNCIRNPKSSICKWVCWSKIWHLAHPLPSIQKPDLLTVWKVSMMSSRYQRNSKNQHLMSVPSLVALIVLLIHFTNVLPCFFCTYVNVVLKG